jgi:hypothetical protein
MEEVVFNNRDECLIETARVTYNRSRKLLNILFYITRLRKRYSERKKSWFPEKCDCK